MSPPRPDPEQVRESFRQSLAAGKATLADLFAAVDSEGEQRMLSHMAIATALEALPNLDEAAVAQILKRLSIAPDEHLDMLGGLQRKNLIKASGPEGNDPAVPQNARTHSTRRSSRLA